MTPKTGSKKPKGIGRFNATQQAAALKNEQASGSLAAVADQRKFVAKSVNLPPADWRLLRLVARARADRLGGRDSVSQVVQTLVERARKDLQKELE